MLSISKVKKCKVCTTNKIKEDPAIIRLQTADGVVEVEVCDECADFFDKSADVLSKRRKKPDDESL